MTSVITFFPVIFNFIIVALVILTIKKRVTGSSIKKSRTQTSIQDNKFNDMINHYNNVNTGSTAAFKNQESMTLKDDRGNDWMARQLRDEAIAMVKVSDMFKLRQEHTNKCDAEFIKRFHESSCDAEGIDDGISKKSRKK